jgi:hypothetical protein
MDLVNGHRGVAPVVLTLYRGQFVVYHLACIFLNIAVNIVDWWFRAIFGAISDCPEGLT